MPKEKSDHLFQLIHTLKPSEKRYFRLSENTVEDKKYLQLFDLVCQQESYNEEAILQTAPDISAKQISNLKAHLYQKLLKSLRAYHAAKVLDIEIREMIDSAEILFNRCLYDQCGQVLKKARKRASKNDNLELQLEILKWEKRVLGHTITKNNPERVNKLIEEVRAVNERINNINRFSNIATKLNALYLQIGYIRDQRDYQQVRDIFESSLTEVEEGLLSFNEKLHLYDLYIGYCFFTQDFEGGCFYAEKYVQLFEQSRDLIASRIDMYIKGINNLMVAQYKLNRYHEFVETNKKLKAIRSMPGVVMNDNIRVKLFKYTYVHEFNRYFMLGDFAVGVALITKIKANLEEYIQRIDKHSRIILYYKIACLYFGNDNYRESLFWVNKIINTQEVDLREDIHCFARILNLISHYELDNTDVIDYYIRSTYRFLLKKDDLHRYQQYILSFLKHLSKQITEEELITQFQQLREKLLPLVHSTFEKRAFIYFDIISWLESKIQKRPVQKVVQEKAQASFFGATRKKSA